MGFWGTAKKLAAIVWEDGGLSWLWAVLTPLPGLIEWGSKHLPTETKRLQDMLEHVQWWWGLVVLAIWIIVAFARRIMKDSTPLVDLSFYEVKGEWFLNMANTSNVPIQSCSVNIERITDTDGRLLHGENFAVRRLGGHTNPFQLYPKQPWRALFAKTDGEAAVIYAVNNSVQHTDLRFPKGDFLVTLVAYTENHIAPTEATYRVFNSERPLRIELYT